MANYAGLKVIVDWDDSKVRKGAAELQKLVGGLGGTQGVSSQISPMKALVAENNKLRDSYQSLIAQGISPASQKAREAAEAFNQTNSRIKEIRAQTKGAEDAYARLSRITNEATRHAQNLGVQYGVTSERFIVAAKRAEQLTGSLKQIDQATGRNFRNVGNYAGSFNAISVNMSRIVGEMPNFAQNMRIGFMAISNNIQPLAESINLIKQKNIELAASGEKTISPLKAVGSALFSWNTLLMVGVTALTVYGPKLVEWVQGLNAGSSATKRAKEEQDALIKAVEEGSSATAQNIIQVRKQGAVLESNTATTAEKRKVVDDLIKAYPAYANQINDEYTRTGRLTNVVAALTSEYIKLGYAKAYEKRAEANIDKNVQLQDEQNRAVKEENRLRRQAADEWERYQRAAAKGQAVKGLTRDQVTAGLTDRLADVQKNRFRELQTQIDGNNKVVDQYLSQSIKLRGSIKIQGDVVDKLPDKYLNSGKATKEAAEKTDKYAEAIADLNLQLENLQLELSGGIIDEKTFDKKKLDIYSSAWKKFFVDLRQDANTDFMKGLFTDLQNARTTVNTNELNAKEEKEANDLAEKMIADAKRVRDERIKSENDAYNQILKKAEDYYQQRQNLDATYQRQLSGLERNRGNLSPNEYKRQFDLIGDEYRKAVEKLKFDTSPILQMLNQDLGRATTEQLDTMLKSLREVIDTRKMLNGDNRLIDVPDETLKQLYDAYNRLKQFREEVAKLKVETSDVGRIATGFGEVGKALQQIGNSLSSNGFNGDVIGNIGNMVVSLADSFLKINTAVKALKTAQDSISSGASNLKSLGQSKDWIAAVIQLINVVVSMFGAMKRYKEDLANLQRQVNESNADIYLAEFKISNELREQNLLRAQSIELTLKQLDATKKVLEENKKQTKSEADALMAQINRVGEFIQNRGIKGRTWLGQLFGSKPEEVVNYGGFGSYALKDVEEQLKKYGLDRDSINRFISELKKQADQYGNISRAILQDIAETEEKNWLGITVGHPYELLNEAMAQLDKNGKRVAVTFAELKKLNLQGILVGETKKLFDQLLELEKKGIDIDKMLVDLQIEANEIFTGTTADNITDAIVNGFKEGKSSMADFADTFEDLMRNAILNSFKYQYLQAPLQEFYQKFAEFAQSGSVLSQSEIESLRGMYQTIIENANSQFENIKQITGVDVAKLTGKTGKNSLSGAISQASQESIDLLAAHTMGARVAQLETNRHLTEMKAMQATGLDFAQQTAGNTGATVIELKTAVAELKGINNKMNNNANNALAAGI